MKQNNIHKTVIGVYDGMQGNYSCSQGRGYPLPAWEKISCAAFRDYVFESVYHICFNKK